MATQAKLITDPLASTAAAMPRERTMRELVWSRFRQHRAALLGVSVLTVILLLTIFVPIVANYDPLKTNVDHIREAPSAQNIFGTDELGRDLFNRLWAGARISLMIGVATMMISVMIGTIMGAVAGYYGGAADNILMRFTDFMLSIPQL
ncbi:MAG: ABC transporter permease, partial [Chloroflexi bacterium]|nr:ABC transporter permease [Chloroflexota bacterium]